MFPISRDPPEGGTLVSSGTQLDLVELFPISRDPPEGGTLGEVDLSLPRREMFPISRDPPEGGTGTYEGTGHQSYPLFPISRDPPEGGTPPKHPGSYLGVVSHPEREVHMKEPVIKVILCFQFLGIPPKGEPYSRE